MNTREERDKLERHYENELTQSLFGFKNLYKINYKETNQPNYTLSNIIQRIYFEFMVNINLYCAARNIDSQFYLDFVMMKINQVQNYNDLNLVIEWCSSYIESLNHSLNKDNILEAKCKNIANCERIKEIMQSKYEMDESAYKNKGISVYNV
jgi:hypothetical protein